MLPLMSRLTARRRTAALPLSLMLFALPSLAVGARDADDEGAANVLQALQDANALEGLSQSPVAKAASSPKHRAPPISDKALLALARQLDAVTSELAVVAATAQTASLKQRQWSTAHTTATISLAAVVEDVTAACASHRTFLVVDGTRPALNGSYSRTERTTLQAVGPLGDSGNALPGAVLTMYAIGALFLIIFGMRFMNVNILLTLFLVSFTIIFGLADAATYREELPPTFGMCGVPLAAAFTGALVALGLGVAARNWLRGPAFDYFHDFIIGFCLIAVVLFVVRDVVLAINPNLSEHAALALWVVILLCSAVGGALAAYLGYALYVVTFLLAGSYTFALVVVGVIHLGADPSLTPGGVLFGIMIGTLVLSLVVQLFFVRPNGGNGNGNAPAPASSGETPTHTRLPPGATPEKRSSAESAG